MFSGIGLSPRVAYTYPNVEVGAYTETDFAQKLAGKGRNPEATLITEIMTSPVLALNGGLLVSETNVFIPEK